MQDKENAPQSAPQSAENAAPEFMNEFRAPEIETDGGGVDDVISVDDTGAPIPDAETVVEALSKDAFWHVFKTAFAMPAMFAPDFKPLAIQEHEIEIGRDASDAIYEILEIYYPSALLPQGEMFARFARAAPFVLAKVMIVRTIFAERRAARLKPVNGSSGPEPTFKSSRAKDDPAPAPANDNKAPDPMEWADEERAA